MHDEAHESDGKEDGMEEKSDGEEDEEVDLSPPPDATFRIDSRDDPELPYYTVSFSKGRRRVTTGVYCYFFNDYSFLRWKLTITDCNVGLDREGYFRAFPTHVRLLSSFSPLSALTTEAGKLRPAATKFQYLLWLRPHKRIMSIHTIGDAGFRKWAMQGPLKGILETTSIQRKAALICPEAIYRSETECQEYLTITQNGANPAECIFNTTRISMTSDQFHNRFSIPPPPEIPVDCFRDGRIWTDGLTPFARGKLEEMGVVRVGKGDVCVLERYAKMVEEITRWVSVSCHGGGGVVEGVDVDDICRAWNIPNNAQILCWDKKTLESIQRQRLILPEEERADLPAIINPKHWALEEKQPKRLTLVFVGLEYLDTDDLFTELNRFLDFGTPIRLVLIIDFYRISQNGRHGLLELIIRFPDLMRLRPPYFSRRESPVASIFDDPLVSIHPSPRLLAASQVAHVLITGLLPPQSMGIVQYQNTHPKACVDFWEFLEAGRVVKPGVAAIHLSVESTTTPRMAYTVLSDKPDGVCIVFTHPDYPNPIR